MGNQTAVIRSTVIRPGVLVTGQQFYARVRWATDSGMLAVPPTVPPTLIDYNESPEQYIAMATDSNPFEFSPDVLWWQSIRETHRMLYTVLEWRLDQSAPWKLYSQIDFTINHDPLASAGVPQQIAKVDINGVLQSDVYLDASASDDQDLHATVNPDPGPLQFKWTLAEAPIFVNSDGPAFLAANNIPPELEGIPGVAEGANRLVFAKGLTFDVGDRGLYEFEVEVSDNDVATRGKDAGKPGKSRASTRVLVTGGTLIDVWVDAFIPTKRVDNPTPPIPPYYFEFAGDDRIDGQGNAIFEKGSARQRMWTSVILDADEASPILHQDHDTGVSTGYFAKFKGWKGALKPTIGVRTAKASATGMYEAVVKKGGTVLLTIHGKAADPFVPVAPPAVYHFNIWLSAEAGKLTYLVQGYHDYFPSCEMYIGSNLAYKYDSKGHSALQLLKPSDLVGGVIGKTVSIPPTTIDLATAFSNPIWREGSGELCYFNNDYLIHTG